MLLRLVVVAAVFCVLVNEVLCSTCGSWASPRSRPMIFSMGFGTLAAVLRCRLQRPERLHALPAVLLAALLSLGTGAALAHQAWLRGCSRTDGSTTLLFASAPALAGRWQR